ncbi:MAG: hypothetical protein P8L30_03445 [Longimicrobiales bacterium]|nr:hypothetical protein [Longimicrobiales bacterium]
MRLAIAGAVIGLIVAAGAARLVQGLLYGVRATDPVAFIGVPMLLMSVAALAVYVPARKAARVNPVDALRSD